MGRSGARSVCVLVKNVMGNITKMTMYGYFCDVPMTFSTRTRTDECPIGSQISLRMYTPMECECGRAEKQRHEESEAKLQFINEPLKEAQKTLSFFFTLLLTLLLLSGLLGSKKSKNKLVFLLFLGDDSGVALWGAGTSVVAGVVGVGAGGVGAGAVAA